MSESKSGTKAARMMLVTVIIVLGILIAVIAAFMMLQRRQEQLISAVGDTQQENMTIEKKNADTIPDTGASDDISKKETEAEEESTLVITVLEGENTDDISSVYLIRGSEKGSGKYERADRLSYTDTVEYTISSLELLDRYGLQITRNEIFARHGRMFNNQDIQEYFNKQEWYVPQTSAGDFDDSCLNEVEAYNVQLIRSYELKQGY